MSFPKGDPSGENIAGTDSVTPVGTHRWFASFPEDREV
jgi:hypothetical protein